MSDLHEPAKRLSATEKIAIQRYILTLAALPTVVVGIIGFVIGFYIEKGAIFEAVKRASDEARTTYSRVFDEITSTSVKNADAAAQARAQAEFARAETDRLVKDLRPLLSAAIESADKIKSSQVAVDNVLSGKAESFGFYLLGQDAFLRVVGSADKVGLARYIEEVDNLRGRITSEVENLRGRINSLGTNGPEAAGSRANNARGTISQFACPSGQYVSGLKFGWGGTCRGQCDSDGGVLGWIEPICRSL